MLTKNNLTEFDLMQGFQKITVIRGSKVNSYVAPKRIVPAVYKWILVDSNVKNA